MNSSDRNHCIHRGVISYDVDCASAGYKGEAPVGRQEQFIYTRNVHPSFSTPKTDLRAWHHCNQQGQEKAWIGRAQCYLGAMILKPLEETVTPLAQMGLRCLSFTQCRPRDAGCFPLLVKAAAHHLLACSSFLQRTAYRVGQGVLNLLTPS